MLRTTRLFGTINLSLALLGYAAAQEGVVKFNSFTPNTGAVGATVTLKGVNFDKVTDVYFYNGAKATFTLIDSSTIQATVPSAAVTGPLHVNEGTIMHWIPTQSFTVQAATSGGGGSGSTSVNAWVPPPNIPIPTGAMTGHPRILLNPTDVQQYQSWAFTGNPNWDALKAAALDSKAKMDAHIVPDKDDGLAGQNSIPCPTEDYAELFAFMSLVDPVAANRADYAKRAHDLLMYVINKAAVGPGVDSDPFRGPQFANFNRSRWYGQSFATVLDWCYSSFTASEKATIRRVFLRWIQENIYGYNHPNPVGIVNNSALSNNLGALRWSSNNYYCNHARQIGFLAMALDAADDVPATASDPAAGTLRAYIGNAIGAWLYVLDAAEHTTLAGGMSPEGMGYGESDSSAIAMLLYAMRTTNVDNPAVFGPQASMAAGQFWSHDVMDSFIHAMSPATTVQQSWVGPSYVPADYGDLQSYGVLNYLRTFGPLALLARSNSDNVLFNKLAWMLKTYEPGTGQYHFAQLSGAMNSYGSLLPIFSFMVFDPTKPAPTDPRPTMLTEFFGSGLNRILARTDWSTSASWFTYKCSWNSTDHNHQDGNMVEFYRKGEWLTKGRAGYGLHVGAPEFENSVSIQNPSTTTNWVWALQSTLGSQYGYSPAGDPTVVHSSGNGYVYAQGDATNLYNCPTIQATDVKHASRSVVWLKPDYAVIYDRADTGQANRFKRFWLNTPTQAQVSGHTATMKTQSGQQLFVQNVLPASALMTSEFVPVNYNGPDGGETAQYEPMTSRIKVEDPSNPASIRFLNVLQGADKGASAVPATALASIAGDAFDGVAVGTNAVFFRKSLAGASTGTTLTVPTGITALYITGLTPNGSYTVITTTTPTGKQIQITTGGTTTADQAGVIKI